MQLRSRVTLAAAFFLLAPAAAFFLIDRLRDQYIASSFVARQFDDDRRHVEGLEREARLRLVAPKAELHASLYGLAPPPFVFDPGTGEWIHDDWPLLRDRVDQIAQRHPSLSFGIFNRDGLLLVDRGKDRDLIPQGFDGTNRSQASGVTADGSAYVVRRTIRSLDGFYVYVGVMPMDAFLQNIANAMGDPVALINRPVLDTVLPVTNPSDKTASGIVACLIALPKATEATPDRRAKASAFWAAVKDEALSPVPQRSFTLAAGEHRGIVTEIRMSALRPSEDRGLFVRLVRDQTRAAIREERQNRLVYGGFAVLILVSVVLLLWFFNNSFKPLSDLIEALRALTRQDFDYAIPHTQRRDELGALARGLTEFRESLVDRERLVSLKEQMEFAAQIQRSTLPPVLQVSEAISVDALTRPAEDVGGDFYDVFALDDGKAGIVVADVADKGMGSALFGALASSLVRATARLYDDPGRVLSVVNAQLCERNEESLFVTLFYGVIDGRTGDLRYSNAGHEPPLLLRKRDDGSRAIERTPTTEGLPLGLVPNVQFASASLRMNPSEALVLFSDGITEAQDAEANMFTAAGLNAVLAEQTSTKPRDIIRHILRKVQAFTGDRPQTDDITLMAVRYDGLSQQQQDGGQSSHSMGDVRTPRSKLRIISS